MKNSDYVTLILAGGHGTGLSVLTKETAKPAVSFGGIFRLIDFTLNNCKHSHTGVIGIVPHCRRGLAGYISYGSLWRGENERARISVLSPKTKSGIREVYQGSADAIRKNIDFIEQHSPRNVLVLSGDCIYEMDYRRILAAHENSGAAATLAAVKVPFCEAPRFGVMNADKNDIITDFGIESKRSKTSLASMGVYVFNWEILKKYLINGGGNKKTSVDIGKDILPQMLAGGHILRPYRFWGYWKDVSNIYSFWEANMELLSTLPSISLLGGDWGIDITPPHPMQSHSKSGRIVNSFVAKSCTNKGTVKRSVISPGVEIGDNATIMDSVIMPGAKIGRNAFVLKAVIGVNAVVEHNTVLYCVQPDGEHLDNCYGISVVGNNVNVYSSGNTRLKAAGLS